MAMCFEYTHWFLSFVISRVVQLKSSPSSFWVVHFTPPDGRVWSDAGSRLCSTYPLPVPTCLRRNFSIKLWRWRTIWLQTYASSFQRPSTLLVSLNKIHFWILQKYNNDLKTNAQIHCICRINKREWWSSAGPLSSRNLPVSHHLPGVPHSRSTCQSGRGLWLCKMPPTSHLTQLSLHGPTSSVRDRRFVPLYCTRQRKQWHCILNFNILNWLH